MGVRSPHVVMPITTNSKDGGFDHEVDVSVKLTVKALLILGVILHIISIPIDSLISYLTASAEAATKLLP